MALRSRSVCSLRAAGLVPESGDRRRARGGIRRVLLAGVCGCAQQHILTHLIPPLRYKEALSRAILPQKQINSVRKDRRTLPGDILEMPMSRIISYACQTNKFLHVARTKNISLSEGLAIGRYGRPPAERLSRS